MSKSFLDEDFILDTKGGPGVYHHYAKCRSSITIVIFLLTEIAHDYIFENITEIWLKGDHYKWQAMRTLGIDEAYITGQASDRKNF